MTGIVSGIISTSQQMLGGGRVLGPQSFTFDANKFPAQNVKAIRIMMVFLIVNSFFDE